MRIRVPEKVTSPIKKLCNRVALGQVPRYVEVRVEPDAEGNDCFVNIEKKIARSGGHVQYGWAIWYVPGVLMEGEFHSVWVSPADEWLDISPRPIDFKRIMFLPDPNRHYNGKQIDNVRIALKKDPLVREFIRLAEERFKIMNEGELANQHGRVEVPPEKIVPVLRRMHQLASELGISG